MAQAHQKESVEVLARALADSLLAEAEAEDPKAFLRQYAASHRHTPKRVKVFPHNQWPDWDELSPWQQRAAIELENELDQYLELQHDDRNYGAGDYMDMEVSTANHDWYRVFKNEDTAKLLAHEYVREMLEHEPE